LIDRLGTLNVLGKQADTVASTLSDMASVRFGNPIVANVSVAKVNVRDQLDSRLTPSGLEMHLNPNNIPIRIAEDGTIYVPYVGNIDAQGKTVRELRDDVTAKVQAQYQNPVSVNVSIQEYADNSMFIGGEVKQPGRYPFTQKMSLLKLIATAGWGNEYADMGNVLLLRATGDNDYTVYRTNLDEVMQGKGSAAQDFKLTPQDLVVVLPTDIAKANRYINQYIKGILPFGANVSYNINSRSNLQ
jgi:protein involved in polysaccharide export with SLBB domain